MPYTRRRTGTWIYVHNATDAPCLLYAYAYLSPPLLFRRLQVRNLISDMLVSSSPARVFVLESGEGLGRGSVRSAFIDAGCEV